MRKLILVMSILGLAVLVQAQNNKVDMPPVVKKVTLGYDLYNTFWMDMPTGLNTRLINQGFNTFLMYNHTMNKKGNLSFAGGLGLTNENLFFKKAYIPNINADSVVFADVPNGVQAKRSKLNMTYLDIPIELRFVTKSKMRFTLGLKFGFLINSKTLYKGHALDGSGTKVHVKQKNVNSLEGTRFGVQARIGYKWIHAYAYYSLNKVFKADKGPQVYPISVGISVMPF